jgi:hypothetical protein
MPGRKQGTYAQTTRVLLLIEWLGSQRHGAPLAEVARRFQVTERQLRRDLGAIAAAGHHLDLGRQRGRSHVRLLEAASRPLAVTRRQRFALLALRHAAAPLGGTALHEELASLWARLQDQHTPEARAELGTLAERVQVRPAPVRLQARPAVLDRLLVAVLDRKAVRARYGKGGKELLALHAFVLGAGGAQLVGHRVADEASLIHLEARQDPPLRFDAARFSELTVLARSFTPPAGLATWTMDRLRRA